MQQPRPWVVRKSQPEQEGEHGSCQHHRHEHGTDAVHQQLDGRLGGLRVLHHPDDAGEYGFRPHCKGLDRQQSIGVNRPSGNPRAGGGFHGQAFPGDHRGIDGGNPLDDSAVHGNTFARTDHHDITDTHLLDRNVQLGAVPSHPGGVWPQAH